MSSSGLESVAGEAATGATQVAGLNADSSGGASMAARAAVTNTSANSRESNSTGPPAPAPPVVSDQIAKAVKSSKKKPQKTCTGDKRGGGGANQTVISDKSLQQLILEESQTGAVSAKLVAADNNNDAAFRVEPATLTESQQEQRLEVKTGNKVEASEQATLLASAEESSSAALSGATSDKASQRGDERAGDILDEARAKEQKQGAAMLNLVTGKMDARAEQDNELNDSSTKQPVELAGGGGGGGDTAITRAADKLALEPEQINLVEKHRECGNDNNNKEIVNEHLSGPPNQLHQTTIDLSLAKTYPSESNLNNQLQQEQVAPTSNGFNHVNQAALIAGTNSDSTTTTTSTATDGFTSTQQHKQELEFLYTSKRQAPKRLGYFQSLLLRKWPCLALSICIMSSLIFGMLLSALTIYLMHDVADCGELAMAALASPSSAANHMRHHHHPHHHHHEPHYHAAAAAAASSLLPNNELTAAAMAAASRPNAELNAGDTPLDSLADANDPVDLTSRHLPVASGRDDNATSTKQLAFQRLPLSLVPEHYNLFIWPHIAEPFYFNGSLEVHIKCRAATQNITLHTHEIDINQASIKVVPLPQEPVDVARRLRRQAASNSAQAPTSATAQPLEPEKKQRQQQREFKVTKMSQDKQLQYSIIHLDQELEHGQDYLLRLDFVGILNDDLAGFYKIKYERQNSTDITWVAATQFQATDARRAFPCFDEPAYKATFSIKIRHWTNMTALSNMPIVNSERSSDGLWITDTFAKSQRMSTYLVAWAVTNFESRSDGNISVWARPGFGHTAEYSLKIARKILRHYEDFFGIEYPLPKMDMIALPDFNAGAMENWGLVTYRETAMLYDPEFSSTLNKRRVATVVAHELAHQWFGNLVTPKWWDDLWLNEGFASFVEYLGVDHVSPHWRMLDQFVIDEVQNVLRGDSLSSSHQISIPVNNPDEISEIFDYISYSKGASVIRMMNHFLTDKVFKLGLQRYLRALKYSNAEQSDLWAHLMEAQRSLQNSTNSTGTGSGETINVERVMNSWTLQTGYPLVTLTRNYDESAADKTTAVGKLEQVRFEPFKWLNNATASDQKWEIPITFTWKSEQNWQPNTRLWMHQNSKGPVELTRSLAPVKSDEWVVLNVQQVGYYRVNYDQRNWRLLIDQLHQDHNKISPLNRAHLMDDMFELARTSLIDYGLVLEASKYIKAEREYIPLDAVLTGLDYIDEMLKRTPLYGSWQEFASQLIEPYYGRYKDLDWTVESEISKINATNDSIDDDALEVFSHMTAISWACKMNNEHCIKRSKELFAEWRTTGKIRIKPALRYPVYCTAIMHGDKSDWDFLWRAYGRQQSSTERDRLLRALGCSREIWILSRYLDLAFLTKNKTVRRQDGSTVFASIAKNNYGRDLAFNFLREHWTLMHEYYGKLSFSLSQFVRSIASSMNTDTELTEINSFYEKIKSQVANTKRAWQSSIEEIEGNVSWRNKHYKLLDDWLRSQTKIKV